MYQLTSEVYLDKLSKSYKTIITINKRPTDPSLNKIIVTLRREKLSIFEGYTSKCILALLNPTNLNDFLYLDDIADLFTFLISNGYTIQTKITKLLLTKNKNIICFISK